LIFRFEDLRALLLHLGFEERIKVATTFSAKQALTKGSTSSARGAKPRFTRYDKYARSF
jgi:hypothetical protein